jgi:hypothetical protein
MYLQRLYREVIHILCLCKLRKYVVTRGAHGCLEDQGLDRIYGLCRNKHSDGCLFIKIARSLHPQFMHAQVTGICCNNSAVAMNRGDALESNSS